MLDLQAPITKVTGVSFGTPNNYMLQNQKKIPLSIGSWKPQFSKNDRITFHLCSYSKLVSLIIFMFHQNKALKKL